MKISHFHIKMLNLKSLLQNKTIMLIKTEIREITIEMMAE
jgi:hypothetical protein